MKYSFFVLFFISNFAEAEEWLTPEFKVKNIYSVADKLTDKTSLSLWVAGALASYQFQYRDNEFRDQWKDHQQMSTHNADIGNFLGSGIGSAAVLVGQYYWDDNKEHWQSHLRALGWATLTVTFLKYSFGKQRPGNKDAYVSFPSGHTSTAFATATSLSYVYGWQAAWIAYPIAAMVGASRMADDMHWISDVVGGAFLGVIVGRATSSEESILKRDSSYHLLPSVNSDSLALNYYKEF